jgi:hypothetical protein
MSASLSDSACWCFHDLFGKVWKHSGVLLCVRRLGKVGIPQCRDDPCFRCPGLSALLKPHMMCRKKGDILPDQLEGQHLVARA